MSSVAQQAKSGFKTFILTFAGALLVFGAFYYVVSDSSADDVSIEDESSTIGYTKTTDESVKGVSDEVAAVEEVTVEEDAMVGPVLSEGGTGGSVPSPFGELVKKEVDVAPKVVLAGAAESTQSTVPDTGVAGMTIGLVISIALFALFAYIVFINPRKYALSKFERDVLDDLK